MRIRDRSLLCMDWDERSLRMVDARIRGLKVRIRTAVHVPLGEGVDPSDAESMGAFIRQTLAEHRIRTRWAVVDIPRQVASLHLLSLPEGSVDDLAAMVHIQIAKDLPFSMDEAVVDFAVRQGEGTGKCDVWVAGVRNSDLDQYQRAVTAAGLKLERIGLRPYANVVAMTAEAVNPGRVLVVDVGPSMTEIDVIQGGRLVFTRAASVSVPAEGLEESPVKEESPAKRETRLGPALLHVEGLHGQRPMEALLVEVSRTIEAYRATDPGARMDQIVLAGTGGITDTVARTFEARFGVATSVFAVSSDLRWHGRGVDEASLSAAIGLALSSVAEGVLSFDFVHPKEPEAGSRERARRIPLAVVTVALFLAAGVVLGYLPIKQRNAEIAERKRDVALLNEDKAVRDDMIDHMDDIEVVWAPETGLRLPQFTGKGQPFLDTLRQLAEVFPPNKDGYITRLQYQDGGRIEIELATANETVGTQLREKIREIKDKKGRPVFEAQPGDVKQNNDERYPFKDELSITVVEMNPPG